MFVLLLEVWVACPRIHDAGGTILAGHLCFWCAGYSKMGTVPLCRRFSTECSYLAVYSVLVLFVYYHPWLVHRVGCDLGEVRQS